MISSIAKVYWRSIKRGTRTFAALSEKLQKEVRELAAVEAAAGSITAERSAELFGEEN